MPEPKALTLPDLPARETNRALATRWFREVWNERRAQTIAELFAAGAIGHTENGDQGPADFKAAREGLLKAFPEALIHDGDEP